MSKRTKLRREAYATWSGFHTPLHPRLKYLTKVKISSFFGDSRGCSTVWMPRAYYEVHEQFQYRAYACRLDMFDFDYEFLLDLDQFRNHHNGKIIREQFIIEELKDPEMLELVLEFYQKENKLDTVMLLLRWMKEYGIEYPDASQLRR